MNLVTGLLDLMQPTLLLLLENIEWLAWGSILAAVLILVRSEMSEARESVESAEQAARLRVGQPTAKTR